MEKKYLWGVIGVVVIILAILVSRRPNAPGQQPGAETGKSEQTSKTERVVKEDAKVTLAAFPEGFPVEAGASSTSGYKYIPANSASQQSTLEYVSQKSLAVNKQIFSDFLGKNGFAVVNKVEQPAFVFFYATKNQNDLSIKIEEKNKQVTVSATYLVR